MFRNVFPRAFVGLFLIPALFIFTRPLAAAGTYSEGWIFINKILKIEGSGVFIDSYEGEALVTSFDPKEKSNKKCTEKDYKCYTPKSRRLKFSIRPKNAKVVNFVQKSKGKGGFYLKFRQHRCEPFALSTDFEITGFRELSNPPRNAPSRLIVSKSGSKRNFSLKGRILSLEYVGTMVGTFEGLYLDQRTGKVHPFSVTNEKMARYIYKNIANKEPLFIGISVAYISGWRKSKYDVFEINLKEEAGGVDVPQPKADTDKKEDKKDSNKKDKEKKEKQPENKKKGASSPAVQPGAKGATTPAAKTKGKASSLAAQPSGKSASPHPGKLSEKDKPSS